MTTENMNTPRGELVRRIGIAEIEANRNRAIAMYGEAFDLLQEADKLARAAAPSQSILGFPDKAREALAPRYSDIDGTRRDKFVATMRKQIDTTIWQHLIEAHGLEKLMDREERDKFRRELHENPPPVTADNCRATLERLISEADMIFLRGIANAFSRLDRRFRSHDGFKIGSRVVLEYCFGEYGSWNFHRHHDETLRDIERVFYRLDGSEMPERYGGIVGQVESTRPRGQRAAWTCRTEYFELRGFKNGNAHLWFLRKDLVKKVNQLLADYYGETIGAGPDAADKNPFRKPGTAVVRNFGAFNSPPPVVSEVMSLAGIQPGMSVLEPSAGTGNFVRAAIAAGATVTAVEVQDDLVRKLEQIDGCIVLSGDFLTVSPTLIGPFDRIVMNPPFDKGTDIEHVMHALRFLKPDGILVAVMSASAEFRETEKAEAFRKRVAHGKSRYERLFRDLPDRSFASEGTNVNAVTCVIFGEGRKPW